MAADNCLLDVRDNRTPYGQSINCGKRLSQTSWAYTRFPKTKLVYTDEAIPRHAYFAAEAKAIAWNAAALSNAKYPNAERVTSLW